METQLLSKLTDLSFVTQVYNDSIMFNNALAHFVPKTEAEREAWLKRELNEHYPVLIAEYEGEP